MKKLLAILAAAVLLASGALADTYGGGYQSGDGMGASSAAGQAIVISKNVNLRSSASTGATKTGSASNGDTLTVLDDNGGTWIEVSLTQKNGKTVSGWVQRCYVVVQPMTLTLRRSNTTAYSAPTTSSKAVGSLSAYTTLTVLGTYDDFYIVNLREASAFIPMTADAWTSAEIEQMFLSGSGTGQTARKTVSRSGPGTSWPEGSTIPAGTKVTISWGQDGWVPAMVDGKLVYIDEDDLTVTEAVRGSGKKSSSGGQTSGDGQTITLAKTDGVTLTFWATPEKGSRKQTDGSISLTAAVERAVQGLVSEQGVRRRQLKGYDIHYRFSLSAKKDYGVSHPYWSISFWDDEEGVVWFVDVDATNGNVLYSTGGDDEGNG